MTLGTMKKFILLGFLLLLGSFSAVLNAAQGDVEGFFTATLNSISSDLVSKRCVYRANVRVIKDHPYKSYEMVYGIDMNTGNVAQISGTPSWIYDVRSVSSNDPLMVRYVKTTARFLDCPETVRLKYNSLSREIREL